MKVLVCGGRHYFNVFELDTALSALHAKKGITLLIEGGTGGACTLARLWAQRNNVEVMTVHANTERDGDDAMRVRDETMIRDGAPDGAVAFPGRRSVAATISMLENAGIKVWRAGDWPA